MQNNAPQTLLLPDALEEKHFAAAMAVALLLHVLAFTVWQIIPKDIVQDIPVRALSIKLGQDEEAPPPGAGQSQPGQGNNASVEEIVTRMVKDAERAQQLADSVDALIGSKSPPKVNKPGNAKVVGSFDVRQEGINAAAPVMAVEQKFVRDLPALEKPKKPESSLGNSDEEGAGIVARYEQMISLWIQKFKVYPPQAQSMGITGDTVIRLRIDRRGNIVYYALERSTGNPLLNRAAIDMVRRANPVPAVPHDYPQGDIFEFLVPVSFQMEDQ